MTALPSGAEWTGGTITEGQFKTAQAALRDYLAGLLGVAGTQSVALATLGALLNGVLAKSAAYTVDIADRGKLIDATTGTWSLTLPAAATAGDGFAFAVRNSGSGVITLDPNGSETIDGAATLAFNAGESCLLVCDGVGWKSVARTVINLVVPSSFGAVVAGTVYDWARQGGTVTSTSYIEVFSARIMQAGSYRVSFGISTPSNPAAVAYGRIYKNGIAYGTERSVSSASEYTFTEDLTFAAGDSVQLFIRAVSGATYPAVWNSLKFGWAAQTLCLLPANLFVGQR